MAPVSGPTKRSRPSKYAAGLGEFTSPRYWQAWLLIGWMRLTSWLPWALAVRLHSRIGRLGWVIASRRRDIVTRNLRLAFPTLGQTAIAALARRHFESLGIGLAETAFAWFGRVDLTRIPFEIEGDEHVYAALAKGRGVILYTGHFTSVEIFGPVLREIFPLFGFMFQRRRNALIDELQRRGREHAGHLSFPSDHVRGMLRGLRRNAVIWYAPDQDFSSRSGTMLPFFGQPVMISTATFRLARATGAAIVPFMYRRLPENSGYSLRFEPAIGTADGGDQGVTEETACTRQLVDVLEGFIRRCPEQYLWTRQLLKHRLARAEPADGSHKPVPLVSLHPTASSLIKNPDTG
jgi:KDO2-lipid IV(A) lauroyltransferase